MSNTVVLEESGILTSIIKSPSEFRTIITTEESSLVLLTNSSFNCVIENIEIRSTLAVGQGPAGPSGASSSGEVVPYSEKIDTVNEDVVYKGEAIPGSSESSPVWRISKTTFTGDDIEKQWANGNADFVNMWSLRLTLTYF